MAGIVSIPNHGAQLVNDDGTATDVFQRYLDAITFVVNFDRAALKPYTVATAPAPASGYGLIMVTDEAGGAVPAFSDLTNWRKVTDRAVIS